MRIVIRLLRQYAALRNGQAPLSLSALHHTAQDRWSPFDIPPEASISEVKMAALKAFGVILDTQPPRSNTEQYGQNRRPSTAGAVAQHDIDRVGTND